MRCTGRSTAGVALLILRVRRTMHLIEYPWRNPRCGGLVEKTDGDVG
jgi:hypothetical protein